MYGRIVQEGGYQILNNIKNGPVKISHLKANVPLYGDVFDFVLSQLMMEGLVRRFERDGEDYVEISEVGRNLPYQDMRLIKEYGYHRRGHYHHSHWW